MLVVIRWYTSQRDGRVTAPEISGIFGPFADKKLADEWINSQPAWAGWGDYKYQIENLTEIKDERIS